LFQVVFHGRMAEERGLFGFDDIADQCAEKMIRRHPHVFGDGDDVKTAADQTIAWEAMKAAERVAKGVGQTSALDGVAAGLPALTRAAKIQARAARVGFDWKTAPPILDKIEEEIAEVRSEVAANAPSERLEDEVGDLLFAVTNLARRLDLDPESALRRATAKFERRFHGIEAKLAAAGKHAADQDLETLDRLWDEVKADEN
jgi:ATP diphosphatase